MPSRIESLSRFESIAVGSGLTSAAVDDDGKLFTWGRATRPFDETMPSGLGYALDSGTKWQLTPKWVEALSEDRVAGVTLGCGFTLAVTNAGAVFSFGHSDSGALGRSSFEAEVLPRRIEALAQTKRQFVAVAAGGYHALALTEEGKLYGWGRGCGHRHRMDDPTPRQLTALIGQRVKYMTVGDSQACAVTEKGELYTWGFGERGQLGHGDGEDKKTQKTPRRVEWLSGVKVAAVAMCHTHTLVADEEGVVWAFGLRSALGLGDSNVVPVEDVLKPARILTLRVRARTSPEVLPFR